MTNRWAFRVLAAAMLALVALSAALQLRGSRASRNGRGSAELTLLAKLALLGRDPDGYFDSLQEQPFLTALEQTLQSPSPGDRARALRRKALWCSLAARPCAKEALTALAAIPPEDRLPAPADEPDVLREVLVGPALTPERARVLEARLSELRLGWFDHLLRERLHHRSGDTAAAAAAERAARTSAALAMTALTGLTGLLFAGVLAWLVLLASPARPRILTRLAEALRERGEQREGESARHMAVVVFFLAASLALPKAAAFAGLPLGDTPTSRAAWTATLELVLFLGVLAAHRALAARAGLSLGFHRVPPLRALGAGALAYLLMWPVLLLVMMLLGPLFERLGLPTRSHPIVDHIQSAAGDPLTLTLWLLVAAVLAPLLEEAVFRGALHASLKARIGARAALFAVAFLFAIIHPQIGLGLVGIFLVGLTLSLVRLHEGSLWPGVVLHAINNGVALLLVIALLSG